MLRAGLSRLEPDANIFFSPVSLGSGFWLPKLGAEIAEADAFLLLIGPKGIGPWQEVEYFTAFDHHVNQKAFAVVPVIADGAHAPGLSFLRSLNWVEARVVTEDSVLHRVIAALKGEARMDTTPLWKLVNPYRGLEAMTEANADYFYSRRAETVRVLNVLATAPDRLPILIGASGVGKSSVALAGVMSTLKAMRLPEAEADRWPAALRDSRGWASLTMRPSGSPLEALAGAFIGLWGLDTKDPEQAGLPRKWARGLLAGDNKLIDLIGATQDELKKRQGEAPKRVVLYLDQGEELYTPTIQNKDDRTFPKEARRFSEVLAEGLSDERMLAFASLRADYFDRLQADEPFFKLHEHVNVPPLDRAQLHAVVTAPADALGVTFENEKIADRITDAAAAEPGALPLLSYLLTDMWAEMVRRDKPILNLPPQAIDVGGVLASRAEAFLKSNPADEKTLCRLLTLRLANVPPEGEPVRRQTYHGECTEDEWSVASRLANHPYRLVVMSEREADERVVAEVAHEAFLRAWPRLEQWLREEREFLIFKGEVERAERRWREMGRADQALLTGLDLARAEERLPARSEDLSGQVIAFVKDSIGFDRAIKQKQLRFQRRVSVGALAAALLMAIMAGFAWIQWGQADRAKLSAQQAREMAILAEQKAKVAKNNADVQLAEAQRTQSLFLSALARQKRAAGDVATALLLALEGLPDSAAKITRPYVPEAEFQLEQAWRALRERLIVFGDDKTDDFDQLFATAAISPDGKRIVAAASNMRLRLFDAETGRQIGQPFADRPSGRRAWSTAFSPDGKLIVAAEGAIAVLWDAETGRLFGAPLTGHHGSVRSANFSPDSKFIVTASGDTTARVWDVETRQPFRDFLAHEDAVTSAAFSPDGKLIVTASSDMARLWEVETFKQIGGLNQGSPIKMAAFSPDGELIVTAADDETAGLWDVETRKQIASLVGHERGVNSAAFSPDGKLIVTASDDKTVRLWDVETAKQLGAPLVGHEDAVVFAAFSPDGERIITASSDLTVRVWDAKSRTQVGAQLGNNLGGVRSAAFSRDGKRIVTASVDGGIRVWNVDTGTRIGSPILASGPATAAAFSPNGKLIVTVVTWGAVQLWDAETGNYVRTLTGTANSAAFSPDGELIVTASDDKTVRLWDVASGEQIRAPLVHEAAVKTAAFSSDGKLVVTVSDDKTARVWDVATGKQIQHFGSEAAIAMADFSPDDKRIITASETARLWDVETGTQIGPPLVGDKSFVETAAFSPDGKRIVTASSDIAREWDVDTGKQIGQLDQGSGSKMAAFSPDGKRIVTVSSNYKTVRLWNVFATTDELVSAAKAAVPRCLTTEQRKGSFLPAEPPAWCIEMQKWPYQTAEWKQWLADKRAGKNPPMPTGP